MPPVKREDKEKLDILERLKLEREVELASNKFQFVKSQKNYPIVEYARKVGNSKGTKTNCYFNIIPSLTKYVGTQFPIQNFDEHKLRGYFAYLRKGGLGENTIQAYFWGLNALLNAAVRERIISVNPKTYLQRKELPGGIESKREYLTMDELKQLVATPMPFRNKTFGDAFIFSCLTGLRISDINKMKHSDIVDGTLQYRQKKSSKKFHYLQLSPQALELINKQQRKESDQRVFWKLGKSYAEGGLRLRKWAKAAGINKSLTWHIGRHTHATMLINLGVDIFVVCNILGHSHVTITQRYAKIESKTIKEAIGKIPNLTEIPSVA
jgi:integrase